MKGYRMSLQNVQVNYEALHKNATTTEKEAYEKCKKQQIRKDVLLHIYIASNGPNTGCTGSELSILCKKVLNSVRARLTELTEDGFIMKTDIKRKSQNNCNEIVFCITPYGAVTVEKLIKDKAYEQN